MCPTLTATLGVKGHRPVVGTRNSKHLLDVLAVVNVATAAAHAKILDSPKDAKAKTGLSKMRRMQAAIAAHLQHVGRVDPPNRHPRVVLANGNAPYHRGRVVDEALADNPHLEFDRLPSDNPCLNPIDRFQRKLRRRATHTRLFDAQPTSSGRSATACATSRRSAGGSEPCSTAGRGNRHHHPDRE